MTFKITTSVKTEGFEGRLPKLDAAIAATGRHAGDDLSMLQKLREAAAEILASPTSSDVANWIIGYQPRARTRPHLGL